VEAHFPYLTSEDKAVVLQDGRTPVWTNKIEWARNYLREQSALARTEAGVWQANADAIGILRGWLLERGVGDPDSFIISSRTLPHVLGAGWARESRRRQRVVSRARRGTTVVQPEPERPAPAPPAPPFTLLQLLRREEENARKELMQRLQDMPWEAFERLVGRLLDCLGFSDVKVVGRPGDEGVDLVANFGNDLLQATVAVQVKRRRDNIAAPDVSYLRDRWSSRADKLLFITTSDYRPGARDVAEDPSHKEVKLICGSELVEVMVKHGLGVTRGSIAPITIDEAFFQSV
jgi:restriction endonuclease Mrr